MKHRHLENAMAIGATGIVIVGIFLSGNAGTYLLGIFTAAVFISAMVVLLDLPLWLRWKLAILYVAVAAVMYSLADAALDAGWLRMLSESISFEGRKAIEGWTGAVGCGLVTAGLVASKRWTSFARSSLQDSGDAGRTDVAKPDRIRDSDFARQKVPQDTPYEPLFGPGAPGAVLKVIVHILHSLPMG